METELTPQVALWIGACITVVGTLALIWAIGRLRVQRSRERSAERTTGIVVENRISTDMENSTLVHPIVEFTTIAGRTLRVECTWSTQQQYAVGARVPLAYDPKRPEEADILGAGQLGGVLLAVFAASIVAFDLMWLAVGVLGLLLSRQ